MNKNIFCYFYFATFGLENTKVEEEKIPELIVVKLKIYRGLSEFEKIERAVTTTGTFDGVHIGHQTILNRLNQVARKIKGESVLLTFFPHPRMVLQPENDLKLINILDEKIQLLEKAGVDHLIIHPFSREFSRTSSLEFVRDILVNQIGTKKLVIGYDHHFGRNREGSFEHLKEFGPLYGFDVEEIPAQDIDEVNISSTKIRKAILDGKVDIASTYLGHPFRLSGKVVDGQKNGRKLGFPTANINIEEAYKLIPAVGIYAVRVYYKGQKLKGMLNIGYRPSIDFADGSMTIEVNIFDFDQDIYGEELKVDLIKRIRDEKKFDSIDQLIAEMKKDKSKTEQIFR